LNHETSLLKVRVHCDRAFVVLDEYVAVMVAVFIVIRPVIDQRSNHATTSSHHLVS
jgi:hypothetical protein